MKPIFRPTAPDDEEAVSAFLSRTLHLRRDDILLNRDLMTWKYWQPRPDWDGSRGYVIEQAGSILAHGAAWPLHLKSNEEIVRGYFWIDWAADPSTPGIGVALMRRMASLGGLVWTWGGTTAALQMRAAMGFISRHPVSLYGRPLRPIRQATVRDNRGWRAIPHFARNCVWNLRPMAAEAGWSALPITAEELCSKAHYRPRAEVAAPRFSGEPEILQHLSGCPIGSLQCWMVNRRGELAGAFALMQVPGQTRIVHVWLDEETPQRWRNLYALAAGAALRDPQSCEVITWCSSPSGQQGLAQNGFRERAKHDLMVYDPRAATPQSGWFDLQMLHGDGAFLHSGRPEFVT